MISSIIEAVHLIRTVIRIDDRGIQFNSNQSEPEIYSALREMMEEDSSKLFEIQCRIKFATDSQNSDTLNELIEKRTIIAESAKSYTYLLKEHIENVGTIRENKKLAIIAAQKFLSLWASILVGSTETNKKMNSSNLYPVNDWEDFICKTNPCEQLLAKAKQAKESTVSLLLHKYLLIQKSNSKDISEVSNVLKQPEIQKLIQLYELNDHYISPYSEAYYLNIINVANIKFSNQIEIQQQIDIELKKIRNLITHSIKTFEYFIDRSQRFLENIWQQNLFDIIEYKNMNSHVTSWCQTIENLSNINSLQMKIENIVEINANYEESLISLDMSRIDIQAELDKCYLMTKNIKLKGVPPIELECKEAQYKNKLLQNEKEIRELKSISRSWYNEQKIFAYSTAPELFYYLPDLLHSGSIVYDNGYEGTYHLPRRRFEEYDDLAPLQVTEDKFRTSRHALLRATIDNKIVVLKRFPMHDIHQRKGFEREISLLTKYHSDYIIHPNAIVESGTSTDVPQFQTSAYIEYPLMQGGDLSAWLKSSRQSWELQNAAKQILLAIIFIHNHNIIHLDIKPGNVLIREDGRMLLTDFEFSIDLNQYASGSTGTTKEVLLDNDGSVVITGGTRGFIAPEIERGESPLKLSDMYSYGALLYFMYFPSEFSSLRTPLSERTIVIPDVADKDLMELLLVLLQNEPLDRPSAKLTLQFPYFNKCFDNHILLKEEEEGEAVGQDRRLYAIRNLIQKFQSKNGRKIITLHNPVGVTLVDAVLGHFSNIPMEEIMRCNLNFTMNSNCYDFQDILPLFFAEIYRSSSSLFVSSSISVDNQHHHHYYDRYYQTKQSQYRNILYFLPTGLQYNLDVSTKLRGFGRLFAKILSEGIRCDINYLCPSLFKYLTNTPPTLRDLQIFDPQTTRILRWKSLPTNPNKSNIDKIGQLETRIEKDITAIDKILATTSTPNCSMYTTIKKILIDDRKLQLEAIKTGFLEALSVWSEDAISLVSLLSFADLYSLISEDSEVNVSDIISSLEFSGYPSSSRIPLWTKELLLSFNRDYLLKFLVFVTGAPNIPSCSATSPLNSFKITVNARGLGDELPVSYPCFFHLDLPDYDNKEVLRTKLTFAIQNLYNMI